MALRNGKWMGMFGGLMVAASALAQSVSVIDVQPQGVAQDVRQVVLRTHSDAVRWGDGQAPDPALVQCRDAGTASGSGRWNDAREWVWQWSQPLPAGAHCEVVANPSFRSLRGQPLRWNQPYRFSVAGPTVVQTWPSTYETVDEDQAFVLQLNAEATVASLQQHVHCRASDVGERIPVQVWESGRAQALKQALGLDAAGYGAVVQCQRRMTPGSTVDLVYGAGVQTPSGVRNVAAQRMEFRVRDAFTAELQCPRERAQAGCLPVRDVVLAFSAPVPLEWAEQVRLRGAQRTVSPSVSPEERASGRIERLRFAAPFVPQSVYSLELPAQLQDDAQRPLANASAFPQAVRMGEMPSLFKFAAAPFGVLERFAEGPDGVAVLPVTVRHVPAEGIPVGDTQLRQLRVERDADIVAWWDRLQRYDRGVVERSRAKNEAIAPIPAARSEDEASSVATRTVSLLRERDGVRSLALPPPSVDTEVIGLPLTQPGFYVLEAESPQLGASLLEPGTGSLFVRTGVLVTNLAVHFKSGREGAAVWVTRLDQGAPVVGAAVQVLDCRGQVHASGTTDAQGLLLLPQLRDAAPHCERHEGSGAWWVGARSTVAGAQDMAFVWSDWQRGIETWRFGVRTAWSRTPEWLAHSLLDRNLLRAGETVSMKHWVRQARLQGLHQPEILPPTLRITHVGSGQQYQQRLQWQTNAGGGRNAHSAWVVPAAAKLGTYTVEMLWEGQEHDGDPPQSLVSGEFRVESFRLPQLQGHVRPVAGAALVQPQQLPVAVELHYLNAGAASGHSVQLSALLRPTTVAFERWGDYSFRAPRGADDSERGEYETPPENARLVADKVPMTLDDQGQGTVELSALPVLQEPHSLALEASFSDPNGEVQTLRSSHTLWPAQVLAGVRVASGGEVGKPLQLQALAVDTAGQPQAGVALQVRAVHHSSSTTRKRLVGGFYSYDNQQQRKDLGTVCEGRSDARGLLLCEVRVATAGEVEWVVQAQDRDGRTAYAADSVWISGAGEAWFGGQDHDRMDVLVDRESYAPGDTARLQVRMPFRQATALVSVEREGILHTQVVELSGQDPTIALPVQAGWGPNVYVSVLALRGRVHEVPWYSFFTWGYRSPRQWWQAFWDGDQGYSAPTAMVDLSKPAFRLGVAELRVQDPATALRVLAEPDRASYQVRETASVRLRVQRADGSPAAHAEVAVAVVDQALLELSPNTSWDVRQALWQRRAWGVETATAQMEVVGRRHYGRKAAAPGGGGGMGAPTRELLDTLLLWQPRLRLDAHGLATVQVPLNDALTSFAVQVVAEEGIDRFGSGSTVLRTTQDLQLISGLPPVVREGDRFTALLTVRNTTAQAMRVQLQPQAEGVELPAQTVELPAQQSTVLEWPVQVPASAAQAGVWPWRWSGHDVHSSARDALRSTPTVLPAVPVTVQQAQLRQLDGAWQQAVERPATALPGVGGVRAVLSQQLADPRSGVPSLRDWWQAYPYACLEQTVGKALGLGDATLWERTMAQLPTYLDDDGLALYFPPQGGQRVQGSEVLTAHLLAVEHAQQGLPGRLRLPDAQKQQMEAGLLAWLEGRIARSSWSPQPDLALRKLAAIAALARSGKAQPAHLESLEIAPTTWPTHTLLDWLEIVRTMPQLPERAQRLAQAQQLLRERIDYQGSQLVFRSPVQDTAWWLMHDADSNAARMLLASIGQTEWDAERPRLVMGLLARQQRGAWSTTVANTWAGLALRQFAHAYEAEPVSGRSTLQMGAARAEVDWDERARSAPDTVQEPAHDGSSRKPPEGMLRPDTALPSGPALGASAAERWLPWGDRRLENLALAHAGRGVPWVALQSLAAVPRTAPLRQGYALDKRVSAVAAGSARTVWQRGDVVRVRLEVQASAPMTWVALSDPIPAGATILGSGLGRDSEIAQRGGANQTTGEAPSFVERGQDALRAYWAYLPEGTTVYEYTLRLNNAGDFGLPPSTVEALYAPEVRGETPNPRWTVEAAAGGL